MKLPSTDQQEAPSRENVRAWANSLHVTQPGYFSIEHAAVWADVHPRTIKRWIAQGLPTYQAGPQTKVLIKPGDIDAFLTKQKAATPDLDAIVKDVLAGLK